MKEFILNFGPNLMELRNDTRLLNFSLATILLNGKKKIQSLRLGIPTDLKEFIQFYDYLKFNQTEKLYLTGEEESDMDSNIAEFL